MAASVPVPALASDSVAGEVEAFLGTWILVPDAELERSIHEGIDRSLSEMSALPRLAARTIMRAQVGPPKRFVLGTEGRILLIHAGDDEPMAVELNAPARAYEIQDGDAITRSAQLRDGVLTVEWKWRDRSGGRVFEILEAGGTLTVQETINSERFAVPLRFDARFDPLQQEADEPDGSRAAKEAAPGPGSEHDRPNP